MTVAIGYTFSPSVFFLFSPCLTDGSSSACCFISFSLAGLGKKKLKFPLSFLVFPFLLYQLLLFAFQTIKKNRKIKEKEKKQVANHVGKEVETFHVLSAYDVSMVISVVADLQLPCAIC